jgi:hypothetical protein
LNGICFWFFTMLMRTTGLCCIKAITKSRTSSSFTCKEWSKFFFILCNYHCLNYLITSLLSESDKKLWATFSYLLHVTNPNTKIKSHVLKIISYYYSILMNCLRRMLAEILIISSGVTSIGGEGSTMIHDLRGRRRTLTIVGTAGSALFLNFWKTLLNTYSCSVHDSLFETILDG